MFGWLSCVYLSYLSKLIQKNSSSCGNENQQFLIIRFAAFYCSYYSYPFQNLCQILNVKENSHARSFRHTLGRYTPPIVYFSSFLTHYFRSINVLFCPSPTSPPPFFFLQISLGKILTYTIYHNLSMNLKDYILFAFFYYADIKDKLERKQRDVYKRKWN